MVVTTDKDAQAKARSDGGSSSRALQQVADVPAPGTEKPHPSKGGSTGYDVSFRENQIERFRNGQPIQVSVGSIYRWMNRINPLPATGNKPPAKKQRASLSTSKCKSEEFWSLGPPLGVIGLRRSQLIDVGECSFVLNKTNRNSGDYNNVGLCLEKPDHESHHTTLTVIMAIESGDPTLADNVCGSIAHPRFWIHVLEATGTTTFDFSEFCNMVCSDIEQTPHLPNDSHRYFLWKNVASHGTEIVYQTVQVRTNNPCRFGIVKRPPCQPKCGPIENAFRELSFHLGQMATPDWTKATLRQAILNVAAHVSFQGTYNSKFEQCGYVV
jgi:hypothetical protein